MISLSLYFSNSPILDSNSCTGILIAFFIAPNLSGAVPLNSAGVRTSRNTTFFSSSEHILPGSISLCTIVDLSTSFILQWLQVPGLSYNIESQPDPQGRQVYTIAIEPSLFLLEKEYNEITSTELINKTITVLFILKCF